MNIKKAITHPTGIVIAYVLLGFGWIFFSDYLVSAISLDLEIIRAMQTLKGISFVMLSGLLIYTLTSSSRDVLNEKINEQRQAKDRLNRAQQIGKIGDWTYDVERDEIYWSDVVYDIFEVDPKQPIPSRIEMGKFYPEEDFLKMRSTTNKAISEGKRYDLDSKIIVPSGEKYIRSTGVPSLRNGKTVKIEGIIQDITSRKKGEFKLKQLAERLNTIADNIPGAIFQYVLYPDGIDRLQYLSQGSYKLWGVTPEEGMNDIQLIWNQFHNEDLAGVLASIKASANDLIIWHTNWRSHHPTKGLRWHEGIGKPEKQSDGSVIWNSIILDITDRKVTEEKLQQREEYLNLITENASDGILACDKNGQLVFFNKILREWSGREDTKLSPAQWPTTYNLYSADGHRLLEKGELSLMKALKYGKVEGYRFMIKAENQPPRHLESNGSALYDNNKNLMGAVVVLRDITERINKEAEISNAILEALDNERFEIASEIHDNLTQILSIVSMNLKNLALDKKELKQNTKFEKAQQFLQEALNQSRDISHRIMPKSISDFGLSVSLEELSEHLEKAHNVPIKVSYNKEFRLKKDAELNTYRIIQEAMTNSLKHANASVIEVILTQRDQLLEVQVKDNGSGIEDSSVDKGIGIRTMRNRAIKLNAYFHIASSKEGTTITLKVPLG